MQWEYLTLKAPVKGFFRRSISGDDLNEKLNALGRDGWELSTAFDLAVFKGQSKEAVLILKRPRGEGRRR